MSRSGCEPRRRRYRHARLAAVLIMGAGTVAVAAHASTPPHTPFGKLDVLQSGTDLLVKGWAIDPDTLRPIFVDVYVDGHGRRLTAGTYRSDVRVANPVYGGYHAFVTRFRVAAGRHTVCAYAIDYGLGSMNPQLGCRTVTVNYDPFGEISTVTPFPGGFKTTGFAFDRDLPRPALGVKLSVDGALAAAAANLQRPDVAKRYPTAGAVHGFSFTSHAAEGAHQVCVLATNVGLGANATVACAAITLNFNPVGAFEQVVRAPGSTDLRVTGWAFDPDTMRPIGVQVSIDGRLVATPAAGQPRPDIAKTYPVFGPNHGLYLRTRATDGEHKVCATAVNVKGGTGNTSLGCRIINAVHPVVPSAPTVTGAVGGYGSARVTWTAPKSDGGAPWTSYTVTTSRGGSRTTVRANATTATVGGLSSNVHYSFLVVANNVAGHSLAGHSGIIVTKASPPPQNTPAPVSTSRYIRNISAGSATEQAMMRREGAADANANPSGHSYLVLLDIGGQDHVDGGVVLSATTRFVSYANLVKDVNAYVDGYVSAQKPSAPVTIAIGTNNDMDVFSASGAGWARYVVNPVAAHAAGRTGLQIAGANDIEPGFRGNYAESKAWLLGYLGATSTKFVFNGSADGCAWTVTGRACNNGWTMAGLYYLSAGAAPSRIVNLPQVYNNTMAAQWKFISLTGVGQNRPRINFGGALTEWTACAQVAGSCGSLTGINAWRQVWSQLQSHPSLKVASLPYATDLRIDR